MTIEQQIIKLLSDHFTPDILQVENDSAQHAGHGGDPGTGQSHFSVYIVAAAFANVKPVACHRMVYEILAPAFKQGLHAVSIKARSPQ